MRVSLGHKQNASITKKRSHCPGPHRVLKKSIVAKCDYRFDGRKMRSCSSIVDKSKKGCILHVGSRKNVAWSNSGAQWNQTFAPNLSPRAPPNQIRHSLSSYIITQAQPHPCDTPASFGSLDLGPSWRCPVLPTLCSSGDVFFLPGSLPISCSGGLS